ncbi:MAG: hypothetical protein NVSMB31_04940 [Vulcanimicrobiaceae bacterium]
MKARRIFLDDLPTTQAAMQRIISVRFAEVLTQAGALKMQRADALHSLRIRCKRLRYSIDLFAEALPVLAPASARIAQLQDELGELHDCDVLIGIAKKHEAPHLLKRLRHDRDKHALRAAGLWADAFATNGPFCELIAYTGFGITA